MLKIELIRFKPQDIVTASTLRPTSGEGGTNPPSGNLPPIPGPPPVADGNP